MARRIVMSLRWIPSGFHERTIKRQKDIALMQLTLVGEQTSAAQPVPREPSSLCHDPR